MQGKCEDELSSVAEVPERLHFDYFELDLSVNLGMGQAKLETHRKILHLRLTML
jgi:hypothetical protein